MTRKIIGFFGVMFLLALLAGAAVYIYYRLPFDEQARDVEFSVHRGESLSNISRRLAREKLIRFPDLFIALARLQRLDQHVKAGEYRFDSSLSPGEILEVLCQGRVILRKVTVPEGSTVEQISDILAKQGLADPQEVLEANQDLEFLGELDVSGKSLEGYLFPDTYHFAEGLGTREILKAMVLRFWEVYTPAMRERQKSQGLSVHEVVTLASIVEKETARNEERPLVASVIHNRLKKKMPLQCDPTVIYGITNFNGNLTRKHLRTPNPYNTYLNRGLPPGPIANPGLESLKAAVEPAETPYVYFVSRNDGSHHFSATIREHNQAVRKYQKRRRRRK